jgi:glycosyltransferase involved in cell wall biosynthesis
MTRRLKVLHVGKFYPPHRGGIETYLKALCGSLHDDVDQHVIVANNSRETVEDIVDGIPVTRIGALWRMASASICPGMAQRIRASDADLVHLHFPNPPAAVSYLTSGHRGKLIIGYHSDVIRQRTLNLLFAPLLDRTMHIASAVVASSQRYIDSSPVLDPYRGRCQVIPYGVAWQRYEQFDAAQVAAIRKQFGPRLVMAAGRLVYYKGFEYLIRAIKSAPGHLIIAGAGPLRASLQHEIERWGLGDRAMILGDQEDLTPYYHAADVFVLPSVLRSEAFGIVQLEAMACGKPVVNTALDTGVPSVSIHGVTGLTVPPRNVEALAAAIGLLMEDRDLRETYGRNARRRVQQEFSLELMASRTLQLYWKVVDGKPAAMRQSSA